MASAGEIVVKIDARQFADTLDAYLARMAEMHADMMAAPRAASPAALASAAMAAAGSSRKVSRRSLLGMWFQRG